MTEEKSEVKDDELVSSIQSLTKENDKLRAEVDKFSVLKKEIAEKEEADLIKQLVEKTGKEASAFEGKDVAVLKELFTLLPEKVKEEKPKSKGVTETKKEETKVEEKSPFAITESGDLTMSNEEWAKFDSNVRNLEWIDTEVTWIPRGAKK